MATTIQQTSLSVQISEQISINGVKYGNNITKTIDGSGKVDQRVMQISNAAVTPIFNWAAALPDTDGTGVKSEFKYFRITNTDDSIGVTISYTLTTATDVFTVYLPAGCSHLLMSNDADATTTGAAPVLQDVASVGGKSDSTTAYIEYVAVFEGGIVP